MQIRFPSHLKSKLTVLHKNLYINSGDPQYYEKILRYKDAHSVEAHYRLARKYEQEGLRDKALIHYAEAASSRDSDFYIQARQAVRRLQHAGEAASGDRKQAVDHESPAKRAMPTIVTWTLIWLLMFNLLIVIWMFHTAKAV